MISFNPFNPGAWGSQVPHLACAGDVLRVLDVKKAVKELDFSPDPRALLLQGTSRFQAVVRDLITILSTPLRCTTTLIFGGSQLLLQCPRYSFWDQKRVISRIFSTTCLNFMCALNRPLEVFMFPGLVKRTYNVVDCRASSLVTQANVPAHRLQWLFGLFPIGQIQGDVGFSHLAGICLGESLDDLSLIVHAKGHCPDLRSRLSAIFDRSAHGANARATLIQNIYQASEYPAAGCSPIQGLMDQVTGTTRLILTGAGLLPAARRYMVKWLTGQGTRMSLLDEVGQWHRRSVWSLFEIREQARLVPLLGLGIRSYRRFTAERPRGFFLRSSYKGFEGLGNLPDGNYLLGSTGAHSRHAMVYVKHKGVGHFKDPNMGWEELNGKDHWKLIANRLRIYGHTQLMVMRVEKRGVQDWLFDGRRRFAELTL